MIGDDPIDELEKEEAEAGEPDPAGRVLSGTGEPMSYPIVERGPAAPADPRLIGAENARRTLDDPDHELVKSWQAGDERAFETLIRRHEKRVFRLLYRMMGTREEAEDVSQETFLSLHRHGKRFRSEARFSTFVYRVAANAALNRRRTLGRRRARIQKLAARNAAGDDLPSSPRDPEDAAIGQEVSAQVREALDKLSPTLRLPVVLYDIEGLPYGEIAKVLGIAEGTVKSRIHRARQALRNELRGVLSGTTEGVAS